MSNNKMKIDKDVKNKKIYITREFDAPVNEVWKAYTTEGLLEQWWAPKPWKAVSKTMDFREGGYWLYYMAGPEGEKHYARVDYKKIDKEKGFTAIDSFCDENGNKLNDMPGTDWQINFIGNGNRTTVKTELTFKTEEDLNKLVEMGFEQGYAMANDNLDELLSTKVKQ